MLSFEGHAAAGEDKPGRRDQRRMAGWKRAGWERAGQADWSRLAGLPEG